MTQLPLVGDRASNGGQVPNFLMKPIALPLLLCRGVVARM